MNNRKAETTKRSRAETTVRDVARLAGVSHMTVSRVINDEANVLPATRDLVNKAIEKLGFSPNKAARSLATGSLMKIGLLYTNPHNTFLSSILLGLLDQARRSDTRIVIVECKEGPDALEAIKRLVDEGIDGIMLGPPLCDSKSVLELLERHQIPSVTVGSQHSKEHIASVCIDDIQAMCELTQHIISLGHHRIAFIIGNPGQSASWLRLEGFRKAMDEAGIIVDEELVVQGRFSYRSGAEFAEKLLNIASPPTAIIASNDDMAAGAIAAAHHRNIDVPEKLTVCGFDDTMFATTIEPELTTIRQPITAMSKRAIELLENNIRKKRAGKEFKAERAELDFELVLRDSDAPP